jgi:hypothetical protein
MDPVWFMKVIALLIWTVLLLLFYGNRIGFWNLIALVLAFGALLNGSGLAFMLLLGSAAVYALRAYDWFVEGFKHRIASRMLWAAALACAYAGLFFYAQATDPSTGHHDVPMGWSAMLCLFIPMFAVLMLIVGGVRKIISTPGDGNGNNWRNAGDRDSDPDNYIWSGNPSHDD